jgi:gluconate 5-dehydrogenase/2-deoxy-D-gluconate 3-dehydrogenase
VATDLAGSTALITGAGRGIGRAVALGLADAGAHVILLARIAGQLEETRAHVVPYRSNASTSRPSTAPPCVSAALAVADRQ